MWKLVFIETAADFLNWLLAAVLLDQALRDSVTAWVAVINAILCSFPMRNFTLHGTLSVDESPA